MSMRSSGGGQRDVLMTAIPLAMLVAFVMFMFGGPTASLKWVEQTMQGIFDWAMTVI